jgi:EAL domain-containing protein (putative c-di-GMP-specific phosphodiesterase class I)
MSTSATPTALDHVLEQGGVRSVFQPIVHLDSRVVVAYEALARGPAGSLAAPDELFAEARRTGRLAQLDELCRRAAVSGAITAGVVAPQMLFVNIEPEVVDLDKLAELVDLAKTASGGLEVVLEIPLPCWPADMGPKAAGAMCQTWSAPSTSR